jgi:ureidoacrylate peracid hydrolase
VTYLSDAIGSESIPSYEAAVRVNYPLIGNAVMKVDDFITTLQSGDGTGGVRVGDTLYGSDDMKIGEVDRIVSAADGSEGYLVVSKGMIFEKELFVPLHAVVRRVGTCAYVNVPKMAVGKMPWDTAPTAEAQREKYGPPMASVQQLYGSTSPTGMSRSSARF